MQILTVSAVLLLATAVAFGFEENKAERELLKRILNVLESREDGKQKAKEVKCTDVQSKCANGLSCYSVNKRCDDHKDCSDGSDELNCKTYKCPASMKKCSPNSNQCVLEGNFCDGKADCNFDADEKNCGQKYINPEYEEALKCKSDEITCFVNKKSMCLTKFIYACDNTPDCDNGEDENQDNCPMKVGKRSDETRKLVVRALLKALLKK